MVRKEFIKLTSNMFLSLNIDLFNLIFDSGIIPNTLGNIVPFYKNKGPKTLWKKIHVTFCLYRYIISV